MGLKHARLRRTLLSRVSIMLYTSQRPSPFDVDRYTISSIEASLLNHCTPFTPKGITGSQEVYGIFISFLSLLLAKPSVKSRVSSIRHPDFNISPKLCTCSLTTISFTLLQYFPLRFSVALHCSTNPWTAEARHTIMYEYLAALTLFTDSNLWH